MTHKQHRVKSMSIFEHPSYDGHEQVYFVTDEPTGLKAIIAVHSTVRGPACGGCRMWPYANSEDALRDVLRLSKGMSYKNAVADLELGGGKSVIIGDSRKHKTKELFEAFGRAVDRLNGTYITAEDVGISTDDMKIVHSVTPHVAGLTDIPEASGDPSPITARGVFLGVEATAKSSFGADNLNGVRVAVQGVGHVGEYLCDYLHAVGAELVITDIHEDSLKAVQEKTGAKIVAPDEIYDVEADIFAPCALGAILNDETLKRLKVKAVAGGANNQLATPEIGQKLHDMGLLYAPDYVINGGGIINVASELKARWQGGKHDPEWVEGKLQKLKATLTEIYDRSKGDDTPPHEVADELARLRLVARHVEMA